jgi:hypothetical protein
VKNSPFIFGKLEIIGGIPCHSEECNDEESLLVLLFALVETLHFVQGDNAGVEACHYAVAYAQND